MIGMVWFVCVFLTVSVFLYVFRLPGTLNLGPEKEPRRLPTRTQGCSLRQPAGSKFRAQVRQASASRSSKHEDIVGGRGPAILAEIAHLESVATPTAPRLLEQHR